MKIVRNKIPEQQPNKTYCAIDSEWHNLNQFTIHRPTSGDFSCLTICIDGETVYFISEKEKAIQALRVLENCVWIIQEAKFDLTQLSRFVPREIIFHKKLIDTLMLEKVLYGGYYNRFGLDSLARRHLGIVLNKSLQKSFTSPEMSEEQIEYACLDALVLRKIWDVQKENIMEDDWYIYKNVDMPMIFSVMDFPGFCINVDGWRELAQKNKSMQEEIDSHLPINPRSPKQVVEFMRGHGFPKIENSQEETLVKAAMKYPDTEAAMITARILDSRMYGKRASTYGEKWIDNYLEKDGNGNYFVCANWNINGAETGRMSCTDPPLQVIPIRETKDYRKLFIPRKEHVLVVGDWSQQEVGIMAHISQDKRLINLYNTGEDIYISTAREMFGKEITHADPLRKRMKSIVLGIDYGLSEYGLSKREGISIDEARDLIKLFLRKFPGINDYQYRQRKEREWVKTILGRKVWLNSYSNQCENNALNAPIQGTAGDMLKICINDLHEHWNLDCPFGVVAPVHDEIVLDVPIGCANHAQELLKSTMENLATWVCPDVKFKADVKICPNSWAEKELE